MKVWIQLRGIATEAEPEGERSRFPLKGSICASGSPFVLPQRAGAAQKRLHPAAGCTGRGGKLRHGVMLIAPVAGLGLSALGAGCRSPLQV